MPGTVRFGLTLSNRGVLLGLTTPEEILELAEAAEAAGVFDHVWVGDQIMAKPRMESITLMAGIAARNLRRVARLGDGWMTTAWPPASFAEMRRRIVAYAPEYGRSFEGLPCSLYYNININEDREAAIAESQRYLENYYTPQKFPREMVEGWVACGTPAQCAAQLQGFVEAGATDILLRFPSWNQKLQFQRCVEEVLPLVEHSEGIGSLSPAGGG